MTTLPAITDYLDYKEYLRDSFEALNNGDGRCSLRSFARMCGSASPNFLKLVLADRLRFGSEIIPRLEKPLGLSKKELRYFEALVAFHYATTFEERDRCYQALLKLKASSTHTRIEKRQYKYYSQWFHSAVRALLGYYRFFPGRSSFHELGRQLQPRLTGQQAESSVKLLERLHLIRLNAEGYYEQSTAVVTSGPEVRSQEVAKFQMEMMRHAQVALQKCPADYRDISTLTLNISGKSFQAAREKIIQLRKELIEMAKNDSDDDRVYQVNIQLFPLTRIEKEEGR
jgi:uncharacterized protein (TIGR02147 family)